MSKLTGGGILGNKVSHVKAFKQEPIAHAVSPAATSQLGSALGYRGPELYSGAGYSPPAPPACEVGVGGGRTVSKSGSQGFHGEAAGQRPGPGRDILSEYGPEIGGRKV